MPTDVGEQRAINDANHNAGDATINNVVANNTNNGGGQLKSSPTSSLLAAAPSATAVEQHAAREPSSNNGNTKESKRTMMMMGEDDESLLDPKTAIQIASNMKDKSEREQVLLKALKAASRELNEAEIANKQANERVTAAREMYNLCAQLLSGYTPLETTRLSGKKRGLFVESSVGGSGCAPQDVDGGGNAYDELQQSTTVGRLKTEEDSTLLAAPPIKPEEGDEESITLPTNEVHLPEYYTEGGGMDASTVQQFRDNFYRSLTKNQANSTNIDTWVPPSGNANLKSKAQLQEWIYIATNWNTGTADLDAGSFRAKHKAFYARMKPVTSHLGRRTGMHLRQVEVQQPDGSKSMMTVFCRYNKAGDKSTVYLDVGRVRRLVLQ